MTMPEWRAEADAGGEDDPPVGRVSSPLKWHGGKRYLAPRILEIMPRHRHYVEPFAGSLAVLLARDPADPRYWTDEVSSQRGVSEVVNDLDGRLVNFWRVLRDPDQFARFARMAQGTPLSRAVWEEARRAAGNADPVMDAWAFFVEVRQSRSGQRGSFTPLTRSRTRRGMNGNVSEWLSAVDGLAEVHARLRLVVVENMDAVRLICREDRDGTLFYCDPPYVHETRGVRDAYAVEMTDDQHRELLETLKGCQGKVILSGYDNWMYNDALAGWHREEVDMAHHTSGAKTKERKTEVLWCNFKPAAQ
jgi:DNA adenine methylase